jgi:hypothetical protein
MAAHGAGFHRRVDHAGEAITLIDRVLAQVTLDGATPHDECWAESMSEWTRTMQPCARRSTGRLGLCEQHAAEIIDGADAPSPARMPPAEHMPAWCHILGAGAPAA